MEDCLFCKIVKGDIPSKKVYEDDTCFAFEDIDPKAPVHVLIVPKTHVASLLELAQQEAAMAGHLLSVAADIARQYNLEAGGFRTVINTGRDAGQSVAHLHMHVLGGRSLTWPPG